VADGQKKKLQRAVGEMETCKARTDGFLHEYLEDRIQTLVKADSLLGRELGEAVKKSILSGGKRMRAAFVYFGYRAVGGNDEVRINYASASIEILHSFFLIHDDVIDKSDFRRWTPTVHKMYKQIYEDRGMLGNLDDPGKEHFASSAAIMAGDVCCSLAYEALFESGFEARKTIEALKMMQKTVMLTGIGEMIDIIKPLGKRATEQEVLHMYYLKTALYTIEAPLLLGAILHGTSTEIMDSLSGYGSPVGIAFQIHDDILGVFGSEKEQGKPVGSDIKEGKQTLLTVRAFEKASPSQKKKMESILGNADVSSWETKEFQEIIESTGSLDYARNKEAALVKKGKEALAGVPIREDYKDILQGMADYIISRQG